MKNIITFCIFFLMYGSALSQNQNLFITGLNITQLSESQIRANLKVYSPDLATYNIYTSEISGNIVTLKVCYNMYTVPAISNLENDFDVNIPSISGNYIFIVKIYRANPGVCSFIDNGFLEDTAALDFTNPFNGTISLGTMDVNGKNSINFYPNPVKDTLIFSEQVSNINITDLSGKLIKQISRKEKSINVSTLAKGIYIITAITKSGKKISKKIIKE
ncbi:T9SS type A sorting domain-containing protein [Chryseobacterium suipulveris]|uniref:T9SS type A sorting domain-containing protein n=1 Tax=Chryseobacterium suipulveris TaxID=2929800 RepID=A0ABY4BQK7_9FLAO|nr:T9SS type A sorting domain-containing protein [Chryseobacterium suipulveris]UOE41400.1 T9SS type A sorting domain-containing protein [Chryseobacterium suipulveris]